MFRVIINYKNYFSQQLLSYIHVCHLSVCRSVYRNIFARGLKNAGRRPRDIFETDGKIYFGLTKTVSNFFFFFLSV